MGSRLRAVFSDVSAAFSSMARLFTSLFWRQAREKLLYLRQGAHEAIVYNPEQVTLGSHAIVSQQAYLCGATHDYEDPAFPLVAFPISIGPYAWVCARATVQPGVSVGEGAVLALGSVATRNLDPWTVYAGVPARRVKTRMSHRAQVRASRSATLKQAPLER
jgi:hypothetical protein